MLTIYHLFLQNIQAWCLLLQEAEHVVPGSTYYEYTYAPAAIAAAAAAYDPAAAPENVQFENSVAWHILYIPILCCLDKNFDWFAI